MMSSVNSVFNMALVLQDGNYKAVIQGIEGRPGSQIDKMKTLFSCLSQSYDSHGPYRDECIRVLECRIILLAKLSISNAVAVTRLANFIYNPTLEELNKKIHYLAKNRFFSDSGNYYIRNTKFSHHLSRLFNSSSAGLGVGLVVLGSLSYTFTDLIQLFSGEKIDDSKKQAISIPMIGIGGALCLAPVFKAFEKSSKDELN